VIVRDPINAVAREHDLVIVGGGIYGACLALEAARRGLKPLLLERGDFGGATSWNSFRFLHGGLRYLQTLDLRRFRQSVAERRWFCRNFPDLVQPQECLMPLYAEGLKRPSIFGTALFINDLLSHDRNAGVDSMKHIERGRVLTVNETVARFPLVDRRDLRGAGVWYDATMVQSQRVLVEILHWACSLGATALNYVEATGLVKSTSGISAVEARDAMSGTPYRFATRLVCNCAGPWSSEVAAQFDGPVGQPFRPSLAFNVLFDCAPPSSSAVAVAPRRLGGRSAPVYFLYGAFGGLLAGTVHLPWTGGPQNPQPSQEQLERFVADLNAAVPGLNVRLEQIVRVFAGLLPVTEDGTSNLSVRPTIWDHGRNGGLHGLVSVSGVKFTTARLVAEKTLSTMTARIGTLAPHDESERPRAIQPFDLSDPGPLEFGPEQIVALKRLVREESVMTIDDLLFRRLSWAIPERNYDALSCRVREAIGWVTKAEQRLPDTRIDPARREPVRITAS
jgi:glycerol-3-phosphate dehydrogenase